MIRSGQAGGVQVVVVLVFVMVWLSAYYLIILSGRAALVLFMIDVNM